MPSELIPFQFHGQDVPAIRDQDGNPWWKASDVCQQCNLKNVSKACERLDADEKAVITLSDSAGRPQDMLIVNEAGLYTLVLSSRKKEAKEFKRWITHDVVPAIRKTGSYATDQAALQQYPDLQALLQQNRTIESLVLSVAQNRAEIDRAKADAAQANQKADLALLGQQWVTLRQYAAVHQLTHQLTPALQNEYGKWLAGHCLQIGMPVYKAHPSDVVWSTENTYHSGTIQATLPGWLRRRFAQTALQVIPFPKEVPHGD